MDEVEEIKHKIDIVDLMSQYLTMNKAGANYKVLCPFHHEKTPSMMVSPEKQIFKCFGCSKGGDVFAFIMEMEGLEFVEALRMLADRAGVILQKSNKTKQQYQAEKDTKSRLYKVNQLAAAVYHKILLESKDAKSAREYLEKRKLTSKTIKDFTVGYAPEKPILYDFLKKRGFLDSEIRAAGSPERFRNRIIFPINDVMGNAVGFTGRSLLKDQQPKYLNTPETQIFHKSRVLYGLDKAKAEIKLQKMCIIVEGQMDVVLSHQAGVSNAVASSGTALTLDHLLIVARYTNNIAFAFDADSAGTGAAKKAIQIAIVNDINARIIAMPENIKDAGEAVEKDPKIWVEATRRSIPALEWWMGTTFNKQPSTGNNQLSGQEKKEIARELLPIIKTIPDQIERSHYLQVLAKKLNIPEKTIIDAFNKISIKYQVSSIKGKGKEVKLSCEETLIGLLSIHPKFLNLIVTDLDYKDFNDPLFTGLVYKNMQSCYTKDNCSEKFCLGKQCKKFLNNEITDELLEKIKFISLQIEEGFKETDEEEVKKEILSLSLRIKDQKKDNLKESFAQKIAEAEKSGNREEVKKLLEEFQRVIK